MLRQKTAASGELAAGRWTWRGVRLSQSVHNDSTDLAKTQTARFDRQLSQRLDCVLTLADLETSPLWGWVLRAYRRRLERAIPAR